MSTAAATRAPSWVSQRRVLEQKLSDLHKCSDVAVIKQVHAQAYRLNLHQDPFVAPKLVAALSLSRHISAAVHVFDQVPNPNILLFNTLIRALALNSLPLPAFSAFSLLQRRSLRPDSFTFSFLLKACVGPSALLSVRSIHSHVLKSGFYSDVFVPNALIDAYSKSGAPLCDALYLFDETPHRDTVSWNSLLAALLKSGDLAGARKAFDEMPDRDTVSWNTILDGYARSGDMDVAFELFERMPNRNVVSWSTMIMGYGKSGDMDMARVLFERMPVKNLVPWTLMIAGYAEKGLGKEAGTMYDEMEKAGLKPDAATIVSVLAACAESGLLGLGKRIHLHVKKTEELRRRTQVCNALVDMYAKCGSLETAMRVFDDMAIKDVVSWNSMLQALAVHGHGERALQLFTRMEREGVAPDEVTFVGVLCACTHVGLINEASQYFSKMQADYGVAPRVEHFGCMVDLLGRAGHLKEAFRLIKSMPMEPNAVIWGTLLGACRTHNNVHLAENVINRLIELEPSNAGNYAMLSNIYAAAGHWDDVAKVRLQMKGTGVDKPPGASSIEVNDVVHEFTVRDRSHPQSYRIYKMINRLGQHLKQVGYVPLAY